MSKMNVCGIFLSSATFRQNGWQNPFIVCYYARFYNASNLFQVRRKVKTSRRRMRQTKMTRQKRMTKQTRKFRISAEEQRSFARRWLIGGEIYRKFKCQFHRKHLSLWFPLFLLIHSCFLSTQRQIQTRISPKLYKIDFFPILFEVSFTLAVSFNDEWIFLAILLDLFEEPKFKKITDYYLISNKKPLDSYACPDQYRGKIGQN